ncbi:olfactory receptor 5V1-like [Gastrophryne carolinensis]
MAYDRYVAVCRPLQYYRIMSKKLCVLMVSSAWVGGALNALMHSLLTSMLLFCHSHDINNFFCDLNTLILLSTSDTKSRKMLILFEDVVFAVFPFGIIITSYVCIISTILKINSRDGRLKTFSSCTSHIITVALFYVPATFLYMKEEFTHSKEQDKLLSMLYLVVVPMLNPLVYSLRNKDIREATARLTGHTMVIFQDT